eukprot:SAG31_NODE_3956_length_3720_cov_1.296879_2_plen_103_part_00
MDVRPRTRRLRYAPDVFGGLDAPRLEPLLRSHELSFSICCLDLICRFSAAAFHASFANTDPTKHQLLSKFLPDARESLNAAGANHDEVLALNLPSIVEQLHL